MGWQKTKGDLVVHCCDNYCFHHYNCEVVIIDKSESISVLQSRNKHLILLCEPRDKHKNTSGKYNSK